MMQKTILCLTLALFILLTGCSSNPVSSEQPLVSSSGAIQPQESNPPTPMPEIEDEITMNQVLFDMTLANLEAGKMTATADYLREETDGNIFLLNRDFEVTQILCDGQDVNVGEIVESIVLYDGYHEIKQYTLPEFEDIVHIEYTGALSGKSELYSWAQEQITPEFALLREVTVCRPMFTDATVDDDPYETILNSSFNLKLSVKVSEGYTAVFSYDNAIQTNNSDGTVFTASGNISELLNCIAVAKYKNEKTKAGDFYFVDSIDSVEKQYEMYSGGIVFEKTPRIVQIPKGLATFDIQETNIFFLESDAFNLTDDYINPAIAQNNKLVESKSNFNVLFIGNSLTIRSDVPGQTQKLAEMYGINITYDTILQDGASLGRTMNSSLKKIQENQYDYVIMQNAFGMSNEVFMADVKAICDAAKERGSIPVLYCPAFGEEDGSFIRLRRNFLSVIGDYEKAAKANDALLVNAAGAWTYSDFRMPDVSLSIIGDGHPNSAGSYLTSCTILSTIFNIHVEDICEENTKYTGDEEIALKLGQSAWEFVNYYKQNGRQPLEAVEVQDGTNVKIN